jgi:hippurate hydrolase
MKIRSLLILLLSMRIAPLVLAQQTPQSLADAELPSLLTIYKDVHSHPELSAHEERTAALVAKELRAAGCEVTEHFGTYDDPKLKAYGVIGVMKNGDTPARSRRRMTKVRTCLSCTPADTTCMLPRSSARHARSRS